jgi:hypothetical protein
MISQNKVNLERHKIGSVCIFTMWPKTLSSARAFPRLSGTALPLGLKPSLPTRLESSLRSLCSYPDPGLSSLSSHFFAQGSTGIAKQKYLCGDYKGNGPPSVSGIVHPSCPRRRPNGTAAGAFHALFAFLEKGSDRNSVTGYPLQRMSNDISDVNRYQSHRIPETPVGLGRCIL